MWGKVEKDELVDLLLAVRTTLFNNIPPNGEEEYIEAKKKLERIGQIVSLKIEEANSGVPKGNESLINNAGSTSWEQLLSKRDEVQRVVDEHKKFAHALSDEGRQNLQEWRKILLVFELEIQRRLKEAVDHLTS